MPDQSSGNAFDTYLTIAKVTEQKEPGACRQVSFTNPAKKAIMRSLAGPIKRLNQATGISCQFVYRCAGAFEAHPGSRGWRLLGRALVWMIEDAVERGDFSSAVRTCLVATKFGQDLTQGDAQTASLGITISDEARRALLPGFKQLSVAQSNQLYAGLAKILSQRAGLSTTVGHEAERMKLGVQFIQDCKESANYDNLTAKFGKTARSATDYLRGLDDTKVQEYFEGLMEAMDQVSKHWTQEIDKPMVSRRKHSLGEGTRIYEKFVSAFASSLPSLAKMADENLAHTRILAVSAWALSRSRMGVAPDDLSKLPASLVTDPYTGENIRYSSSGSEFKVYCLGENLDDDGGDTDELGLLPDVALEPVTG